MGLLDQVVGKLPGLVDQLTPGGKLPEGGDLLSQGLDMLKKGGLFG